MQDDKRPIIGVSTNILVNNGWPYSMQERVYVNSEYIRAIEAAGGVPILLPTITNPVAVAAQVEMVDGLVLSGGFDVNPLCYGEEPVPGLGGIYPEVDEHQLAVINAGRQKGKPMFGICRGMQIMNVAFGGTLYQDLATQYKDCLRHEQGAKGSVGTHTVELVPGSRLQAALGESTVLANSFHHQAIKKVAPEFVVTAKAKDGIIEGIEHIGEVFMAAVQWHPEMMAAASPVMARLFADFIQRCSK